MEHIQTPWYSRDNGEIVTEHGIRIDAITSGQVVVAKATGAYGLNAKDNAAFIVRACNAHDELVSKLSAAREIVRAMGAMESVKEIDETLAKVGVFFGANNGDNSSSDAGSGVIQPGPVTGDDGRKADEVKTKERV